MIDENGRLFGKVNLIDLLIVILVLALLAFVATKVIGREDPTVNYKNVQISFYAEEVPEYVIDYLKEGESVFDYTEDVVMGTVSGFELAEPLSYLTDVDGQARAVEKVGYKSVTLNVTTTCELSEHGAVIGGTLYGVGHTTIIYAGKAKLWAKISAIEVVA